jgi:ABC-type amino acid transport/signal transduction systems, periplasmic component/domain
MRIACLRATMTVLSALAFIVLATAHGAGAQEQGAGRPGGGEPVTVGVHVSPPFVMKDGARFVGMAVELWEELAARLQRPYTYREYETFGDLVRATEAGEVDLAVSNLTVTERRAQQIDFTQPWFDGGLRIMISEGSGAGFWDVMGGLSDSGYLRSYAWIALVILAAAVLLTAFDRHFDKDFPRRWRDGFAESFYTVMQVATTGRPASRKNLFGWVGRIWQGLWLMAGVAVLAFVTSSVTSVMTTLALTNQIHSIQDLAGRTVGVLRDTVAHEYVREAGLRHSSFLSIEEAVAALGDGSIAAIVEDAPVLEYYAHSHPRAGVRVVGRLFEPDKYAFGTPHGSGLRRPVTVQILAAHERGEIARLRTKYFGDDS